MRQGTIYTGMPGGDTAFFNLAMTQRICLLWTAPTMPLTSLNQSNWSTALR
jgi:hypothetical protein